MKVILAGVTGFIGGEVLNQCLHNPAITSIVALSRRNIPLPIGVDTKKLKVKIMEDFLTYPDDVLQELKGAEGCVWYVCFSLSFRPRRIFMGAGSLIIA